MSTLFQEALVDARKLREVATAEAKAAVLEAVAPTIKQMIDREIAGLILEQEEPAPAPPADMPAAGAPVPPKAPSPDAGSTGPISPAPASGEAPAPAPAVAAASPPIVSPSSQVLGTIEAGPTGEQQIVIPVDALFQQTSGAAAATGEAMPETPPAPDAAGAAPLDPAAAAVEPPPPPAPAPASEEEPAPAPAPPIAEMVARLLSEQTSKATPPPVSHAPSSETYAGYRDRLTKVEALVENARRTKVDSTGMKSIETQINELRKTLSVLKENSAISRRLFALNEDRLGLLHESLQISTIYPQEKGTQMAKTNDSSVKALIRTLLEGAEGFEHKVGKVSPAGDSEGIDDNHAKSASGNTAGVKADAERAKFPTKEKKDWPGKPSPESLLEQLEEEVAELMAEMDMGAVEEGGDEMSDEMVLEMDDKEIVAEAKKAKARIKALREQAESEEHEEDTDLEVLNDDDDAGAMGEEEAVDDSLTLTIDLDGVSGAEIDNVNVSLDGEALDGTETEEDLDLDAAEGDMDMGGEGEEEGAPMLSESARRQGKKPAGTAASKLVNENKVLKQQLQETQLLTARSLYVNKLFVREGLTGTQKRKIVEYLDSARTVTEAKEIYNRVARVLDKAGKKAGMVSESAERRSAPMLNEAAQPCFDTSRWQVLAGVKKTSK